ncbi:hypothetical protein IC575_003510 [Cucumis melo]|uniref:Uncharacterized protein LOC103492420 n=1 Tax=Cucumis melo TaxID=3656 RepID=A0A1S4DZ54_CUCME|nr:uncharacterized protein LOC103492420 [Cucumis melo]
MRFWMCKIHCPSSFCLCQPAPHIYSTGSIPLDLENSSHLPSEVESVIGTSGSIVETLESKQECRDESDDKVQENEYGIKSSLRKPSLRSGVSKEKHVKRVQWMDFSGKELVEIREFEASEAEDSDYESEDNRSCICTIL